MAPRTLSSTWRSFERLARSYLSETPPSPKVIDALDDLIGKVNNSRIVGALAELFVHPHPGMDEVSVAFGGRDGDGYADWAATADEENNVIILNPVGIVLFSRRCEEAVDILKTPEARSGFQAYRLYAYHAELRKLPGQEMLVLSLLREVARFMNVTRVEKRGGGTEDVDDGGYMALLWAFKELERAYREMKGQNLRLEHSILWYESDWISGKN